MNHILATFFLVSLLVFGCNKPQKKTSTTIINYQLDSLQLKKNRVAIQKAFTEIPEILKNNANFESLSKNIDTLNTVPLYKMEYTLLSINEAIEELKETLPADYKNKSVLSRLNEMFTYSKDATYRVAKKSKDTALLNKKVSKIIIGYNHLLVQIDETTFKLPEDFKKELEREKEIKKDTVAVQPLF